MTMLELAAWIDSQRFQCRLREVAFFNPAQSEERVQRVAKTLSMLSHGRYLVGLGPNFSEIVSLRSHPVRLGRHAGPGESTTDEVIDFAVSDAGVGGPREVSRLHCTITPDREDLEKAWIVDDCSSTGTWLFPEMRRIDAAIPTPLRHGALICLGPSGTNLVALICLS
jgi:hypothetical protein